MGIDYGSVYPNIYWDIKTMYDTVDNKDSRKDRAIKDSKNLQCKIDNLLNKIECLVEEHKISNEIATTLIDIIKTNNGELIEWK